MISSENVARMGGGTGKLAEMLSRLMEGDEKSGKPIMPQTLLEIWPQCLDMFFPHMPKKQRSDYILEMLAVLMEHGSIDFSEKEKAAFTARVVEKVKIKDTKDRLLTHDEFSIPLSITDHLSFPFGTPSQDME